MFCSDLPETLNIMKSTFDECKDRKSGKAKINKSFFEDSFKKVSSGETFKKEISLRMYACFLLIHSCCCFNNVFFSEKS